MSHAAAASDLSLSDRFARLLGAIGHTAAARLARNRAATPLLLLLWARLQRTIRRFARLAAHIEAGTVNPPRPHGSAPTRERPAAKRLPRGMGWLGQLVPETRVFGIQLQQLLADPKMAALLAAAPHLARLLRPVCQMLGVQAALPRPPRRPATKATITPAPDLDPPPPSPPAPDLEPADKPA